jgi:hypothetical protein
MKEDTRVVSVDSYFGKKNITKKEFVRRWSTPAMENLDTIPGSRNNNRREVFWSYDF